MSSTSHLDRHRQAAWPSDPVQRFFSLITRLSLSLSLFAVVISKSLSPALPGSGVGLQKLIAIFETAGDYLAQLSLALCLILGVLLAMTLVVSKELSPIPRLSTAFTVLLCAAVGSLASRTTLAPIFLSVTSYACVSAATLSSLTLIRHSRTRGLGFTIFLGTLAAFMWIFAQRFLITGRLNGEFSELYIAQQFGQLRWLFLWLQFASVLLLSRRMPIASRALLWSLALLSVPAALLVHWGSENNQLFFVWLHRALITDRFVPTSVWSDILESGAVLCLWGFAFVALLVRRRQGSLLRALALLSLTFGE